MMRSGPLAQPAGLPCGALARPVSGISLSTTWTHELPVTTFSKPRSAAAIVAPTGWKPLEAAVHPVHEVVGAGMQAVIDNTMRFSPNPPKWGKTRELSPSEIAPKQRILASSTLLGAKGVKMDSYATVHSPEEMCSVLPPYAPAVSTFIKYAPERTRSGFVSSPSNYAGRSTVDPAAAAFKASFKFDKASPNASPSSTMSKFEFDRTAGLPHIPVSSRKQLFGAQY